MSRLPIPGSDKGTWGEILNNYLSQSHNSDGSLKAISETNITNLQTDLAAKANTTDLAPVATTGSYTDLANKPTISTGTDASLLTTGTVADARLPATAQAATLSATYARTGHSFPGGLAAFMGDSTTLCSDIDMGINGNTTNYFRDSWPDYACLLSGQRLQRIKNAGVGGN